MEPSCEYCKLCDEGGPCSILSYYLRNIPRLNFQGTVSPSNITKCELFDQNSEADALDAEDAAAEVYLTRKQKMEEGGMNCRNHAMGQALIYEDDAQERTPEDREEGQAQTVTGEQKFNFD